jgi:hypothetical protein
VEVEGERRNQKRKKNTNTVCVKGKTGIERFSEIKLYKKKEEKKKNK